MSVLLNEITLDPEQKFLLAETNTRISTIAYVVRNPAGEVTGILTGDMINHILSERGFEIVDKHKNQ